MGIRHDDGSDSFDFTNPQLRVQFRDQGPTMHLETAEDGARTLTVAGPDIKPGEDKHVRTSATRVAMAAVFHRWFSQNN
jgi:hypothetical protein